VPRRLIAAGLALAVVVGSGQLSAQLPRPLIPLQGEGNRVAPFFDGWYENADGTITFSFGYSNLNKETIEIPLGPDNFITPKEYDGRQPTTFLVFGPDLADGGGGGGGRGGATPAVSPATAAARAPGANAGTVVGRERDRDRGVFTVTVPAGFKGDVVWTLKHNGQTYAIPGRSKSTAYQLSWPAAMGTTPPLVRFQEKGPSGRGPTGVHAPPLQAKVDVPIELGIWLTDDAVHDKEPIKFGRERPGMNVTWLKYAGPGAVEFEPQKVGFPALTGQSTTKATFKAPGEYVVRVKADAFGYSDSSAGNQCCWTNGYQKVTVTR
jgi:hypothetical protein